MCAFPEPQPYVFDTSVQANCENKFTIISSECKDRGVSKDCVMFFMEGGGGVKRVCDVFLCEVFQVG